MSNQTLEDLRKLSAANMQANQDRADVFRPDTRPEWTKLTANVKVSLETRTGERKDGEAWASKVVCLHLTDCEILETFRNKVPVSYQITETAYDINYAERAKSALGYTIKSIADLLGDEASGILEIDGKRVTFEEKVIAAPKDKDGNTVKDKGGYALRPTFYLAVVEIVGAKPESNPADNTQLVSASLAFATGKTRGEFTSGVVGYLKEQGIQVSDNDQLYLISKFIPEQTKASKLGIGEDQKFVLV